MHHSPLWYFLIDALADLRTFLWEHYADAGQMVALIESDARAALHKAKQETR